MCVKPFGRTHTMTRPNKLFKDTTSYNLTIEKKDYEELKKYSTKESDTFNMQVSIADLIRTSVKLYLEDLHKAYGKETNQDKHTTKK
jgi:hypothetical protein